MLLDYLNQGSAAGQGTTANIGVQTPNRVSSKTFADELGNIQYEDPNNPGQLITTDRNKQVALRDPTTRNVNVYNRTPDTNEGRLSGLGHLMETGIGPSSLARPLTAAGPLTARAATIQRGNRIGVQFPRAVVSTSPITRLGGAVVSGAPGGGPFRQSVTESIGQLGNARGRAIEMAGGSTDPAIAGGNVRSGIKVDFKNANEARLEEAYGQVAKLVNPNVKTPLAATQKTVATILARRKASGTSSEGKAVEAVKEAVLRPEGLTFNGLKDLRTRLGTILRGATQEGLDKGELKEIYAALANDLEASARNAGGEQAAKMAERASALAKSIKGWEEGLKKVLGGKMQSNEGITETILRAARKEGGDLNTLSLARSAVPAKAWKDIASTAISRLGLDSKDQFSPSIFLTDYNKLSDRGKKLLFASSGNSDLIPFLDDIAGTAKPFHEAGKMVNFSNTAAHQTFLASLYGALGFLTGGQIGAAGGIIGGIAGTNVLARVLGTKATAASLARMSRAHDAWIATPGPRSIAVLNATTRNFANTVNSTLGTNIDPNELTKAVQRRQ
jgi:hypothetical protein